MTPSERQELEKLRDGWRDAGQNYKQYKDPERNADARAMFNLCSDDLDAYLSSHAEDGTSRALAFIESRGYRRCDVPACNCGSWHGGHAENRLGELHDALEQAGIDMNGRTLLKVVTELAKAHAEDGEGRGWQLTPQEVELIIEGLTQREMWQSGYALADRFETVKFGALVLPAPPSIPEPGKPVVGICDACGAENVELYVIRDRQMSGVCVCKHGCSAPSEAKEARNV